MGVEDIFCAKCADALYFGRMETFKEEHWFQYMLGKQPAYYYQFKKKDLGLLLDAEVCWSY